MRVTGNVAAEASADAGWTRLLGRYRRPDSLRGATELVITALPYVALWAILWLALRNGLPWLYVLLLPPAAGFLVRLFMIQHDCGHGSFFANRHGNDWVGRAIGVLTLTPYDHWRRSHAVHHATSGNLDRRGVGDMTTLTVAEYCARSPFGRLRYRLYRHPAVLFGLGPLYHIVQNRLPFGFMRKGWTPWVSTMATNAAIVAVGAALIWTIGWAPFLLIQLPIALLASAAGIWLFYVQHQFDETYWAKSDEWQAEHAALAGSSYYDLPTVLRWFTANIGLHHVHHLSSKIPFYRLPQVVKDYAELRERGRVTLWQSVKCLKLALWDEISGRMISFKDLRKAAGRWPLPTIRPLASSAAEGGPTG